MRTYTPSRSRRRITLGAGITATALMMSGCLIPFGGGDSSTSSDGALEGIDQARPAVVRIIAEGSYVDPAEGLVSSAGSGSGFIIDAEGHVVTNSHVVEGAGLVRVYVDDEAVNARILGVSECNDLAVLDLEGDGYDYLNWHQGSVEPGLEVYTAGFPLGDPEYTLTRGIVSKASADGASSFASLDYTIEHDAAIQPGNSGGPLLDANGRVVGVNYGSSSPTNTSQYFAIPAAIAEEVTEVLATGKDVESIGINGTAWFDAESDIGGIWVSGVRAGSAASNAGVEPGDVLLGLAGRDVVTAADQATKRGYCDVLRTQGVDSPMTIVVYRPGTDELLEGEINNPAKPLAVVGSVQPDEPDVAERTAPAGFRLVSVDNGRLTTVMPEDWTDNEGRVTTEYGEANALEMTPDSPNFLAGEYSAAGVLLVMFDGLQRSDLQEVRNFLGRTSGLNDMCSDEVPTNEPTLYDSDFETYYYVDRVYYDCMVDQVEAEVATMWFPEEDLLVGYVGVFKTDRQFDIAGDILFGIDIT